MCTKSIAVIGLGNVLPGDEGIGVHALNELKGRFDFPENVELIDGGTMGLDLLPFIEGKGRILFIDAVDVKAEPGTVIELEGEAIPACLSTKLSVHQVSLPDLLTAGSLLGTLPEYICLIGMQPYRMEMVYGLSPIIKDRVEELMLRIIRRLNDWGVNITY
jgi:hydrogenase maturation protease